MRVSARWWKEHLCTGLNIFRSISVCYKISQCAKMVIYKICFSTNLISSSVSIKAWLKVIENNINCLIKTTQIGIQKDRQYKFYNNFGDLSIRSFWYQNSDTKRNTGVMLCSHCPFNGSSGYLHNTIYLAVMLKDAWHTVEGN